MSTPRPSELLRAFFFVGLLLILVVAAVLAGRVAVLAVRALAPGPTPDT